MKTHRSSLDMNSTHKERNIRTEGGQRMKSTPVKYRDRKPLVNKNNVNNQNVKEKVDKRKQNKS